MTALSSSPFLARPVTSIPSHYCSVSACEKPADKSCGKCRTAYYCSVECQKIDWRAHKPLCQKEIKHVSSPCAKSAIITLQALKATMSERDMGAYGRMLKVLLNWNTLGVAPDYLKEVPASSERELLTMLVYLHEEDSELLLHNKFGTVPGVTILQKSDCLQRSPPMIVLIFILRASNGMLTTIEL